MVYEVILPKLGQTVEEGRIVEWLKQEGDAVDRGEVLFTVETDKAVLDVESKKKGFMRKILVPAGETRPVLEVVALMTRHADEPLASGHDAEAEVQEGEGERRRGGERERGGEGAGRIFVSPRARKYAREHGGADFAQIEGSGPNGRIVERDVIAYLEAAEAAAMAAPTATPVARNLAAHLGVELAGVTGTGPGGRITKADVEAAQERERAPAREPAAELAKAEAGAVAQVPLSGVRGIIAQRMHESHSVTAPVTLTMEVDATDFVALREKLKASLADELGFNLGYNDLLIQVAAKALRAFPYVNARLVGDAIQHLDAVHVGLAIDTERGLLVPVVRDADAKGLAEIGRDVRALVARARAGKLLPDELEGGTFTITNLGMYDVDGFTPIINYPETAILGVGRIKARPAVWEGELCIRQILWLSLTFDHRLVDGAPAARFLQYVKRLIEEPYRLVV